ncbi:MAG: putative DNA binding domain-containing protein [Candidatus Coatesbacteria bacterium]|nr:putative DNA binding domain-containing protein [Candidatus Coatesbacteria bacterium]
MTVTLDRLEELMRDSEDEHLEFKEATSEFSFDKLVKYCAALANERGGRLILGVTNKRPRRAVGSQAFRNLSEVKLRLREELGLRIDASELLHRNGRVLVFSCPSRPIGMPIQYSGAYWMRLGESLVPMTPDQLKTIFAEEVPDYSAQICEGASSSDLDQTAILLFRQKWVRKSRNEAYDRMSDEELLEAAELIHNGTVTYAALILLGTHEALGKFLGQAEVIFEYRISEASIRHDCRQEYRRGILLFADELWNELNKRNDVQHFREGLFVRDIPTFNEDVVREAVINAISHRDYRMTSAVFICQFPHKLEITSPGGFLPGISPENIIWQRNWRNRRLAEALNKCGIGERSGQGADMMFEQCIREGKPMPDFAGSDDYQVSLILRGDVQDPPFLEFLEKVGSETLNLFSTRDFLVLDLIHREGKVPVHLKDRVHRLAEQGVVDVIGRGRGTRYILSRRFYRLLGKGGVYTPKKGLDRDTNKQLLLKHIRDNTKKGSQLKELMQVLPMLTRGRVRGLLYELQNGAQIYHVGRTRNSLWFPGARPTTIGSNRKE